MAEVYDLPARVDFPVYCGGTWRLTWTYKVGSPATPVNLTGYAAVLTFRDGAGVAVLTLTSAAGQVALGGAAGTVAATAAAALTAPFAPRVIEYDLLLTAPDGTVVPLSAGLATFRKGPRP